MATIVTVEDLIEIKRIISILFSITLRKLVNFSSKNMSLISATYIKSFFNKYIFHIVHTKYTYILLTKIDKQTRIITRL